MGSIQDLVSAVSDNRAFTGDDETDFDLILSRLRDYNGNNEGILRKFFLAGGISAMISLTKAGRIR